MKFIFFFFLLFIPFSIIAQEKTETLCRFYTYNDESVFKKVDEKTLEIDFFVNCKPEDSLQAKLTNIFGMKKGVYKYNINQINDNEITVSLSVSNLFDAHYLRIILEHQMNIKALELNDNSVSWDEFEKMFLPVSN